MSEVVIDRTFRDVIPPLTDREYIELEASILSEGCRDPITVWNNIIIDGHHRYDICKKRNIAFNTREVKFKDKGEALKWMISNQLARRNLTKAQKAEMVLKRDDLIGGTRTTKTLTREKRKELAEETGVSESTLSKVKNVLEKAPEEVKEKMRKNEISITNAAEETSPPKEKPKPKPKTPTPEGERYPIESRAGDPVIYLSYRDHKEKIGYYAIVTFTDEKAEVEEKTTAYHEVTLDSCLWRCDKCPRSVSSEQGLSDLKREGICPGCGVPISAED